MDFTCRQTCDLALFVICCQICFISRSGTSGLLKAKVSLSVQDVNGI